MKIFMRLILILTLFYSGVQNEYCAQTFKVEIFQDDVIVEIKNQKVELEKKEFQIRVTLKKLEGVFMNASFQKDYFGLKPSEPIKDYQYIDLKTMAEAEFNTDKELFIHNEYFNYLFYNKAKDWHRFDQGVVAKRKKAIGTKTVQKLWLVNSKKSVNLKENQKDLYLFFVAKNEGAKAKIHEELGRLQIHIQWKRF
jgi:Fe-S oxidoreductase